MFGVVGLLFKQSQSSAVIARFYGFDGRAERLIITVRFGICLRPQTSKGSG